MIGECSVCSTIDEVSSRDRDSSSSGHSMHGKGARHRQVGRFATGIFAHWGVEHDMHVSVQRRPWRPSGREDPREGRYVPVHDRSREMMT